MSLAVTQEFNGTFQMAVHINKAEDKVEKPPPLPDLCADYPAASEGTEG